MNQLPHPDCEPVVTISRCSLSALAAIAGTLAASHQTMRVKITLSTRDADYEVTSSDIELPTRGSRDEAPDGGYVCPDPIAKVYLESGETDVVTLTTVEREYRAYTGLTAEQFSSLVDDRLMEAACDAAADAYEAAQEDAGDAEREGGW